MTAAALELARQWCAGEVIDGAPALRHAVCVARKLDEHLPHAAPALLAAALLHDSPYFAPAAEDLDAVLHARVGPEAARIVRDLEREHQALAGDRAAQVPIADPGTLCASAADKIVSLRSILERAAAADDPAAHWRSRPAFVARVGYFRDFQRAAAPRLPEAMARELGELVEAARRATAGVRGPRG